MNTQRMKNICNVNIFLYRDDSQINVYTSVLLKTRLQTNTTSCYLSQSHCP